jgi:hypothetical protein
MMACRERSIAWKNLMFEPLSFDFHAPDNIKWLHIHVEMLP